MIGNEVADLTQQREPTLRWLLFSAFCFHNRALWHGASQKPMLFSPETPSAYGMAVIQLRHSLREEKLKKADELLAHRLVYCAIIFVILLLILCTALRTQSGWIEWACLIGFFAAVFFVVGRISVHYRREKKDAEK